MQQNANHVEILHLMPGRARLRLQGDDSSEKLTMISQYLQQQDVIKSVKIKEITGNLVIEFDPKRLTLEEIQEYLASLNLLLGSSAPNPTVTKPKTTTIYDAILSLLPPIASLLIIRRLSLSGWKAIALYLVTTGVIQGITEQIKLELFPSLNSNPLSAEAPNTTALPEAKTQGSQSSHPQTPEYIEQ